MRANRSGMERHDIRSRVAIITDGATSAISALVAAERFARHFRDKQHCANVVTPALAQNCLACGE
jgi:hypothetical protein